MLYMPYTYVCYLYTLQYCILIIMHICVCVYSKLCGEACHIPLRCAEVEKKTSKDVRYDKYSILYMHVNMTYYLCHIIYV